MRLSLAFRVFVIYLVFTVGAGVFLYTRIEHKYDLLLDELREQARANSTEVPLQPVINVVASAYLETLGNPIEEIQGPAQEQVSEAIRTLMTLFPAIDSIIVVNRDLRICFASVAKEVGQGYTRKDTVEFLRSEKVQQRALEENGIRYTEVVWPVYGRSGWKPEDGPQPRLGSVLVRYKPGVVPPLAYKGADLRITPPSWDDMVAPFAGYLLVIFGIGVIATFVMTVPIRRLERGLKKLKENKWRGQLDSDKIDAPAGLASAVEAINEMAGQLAQLDARSREREALLATLAQSLEEGMLVLDASGEVVASNPAARRILTGAVDDPSGGMGGNGEIPQRTLHDLTAASMPVSGEVEIDRGDGTSVHVQVSKIPFEVRPGESGTLVLLRDVAILNKVESHLLEAGRFSTLAHLAGALAHEIRNPLNAIGLNAAAIQQVLDEPAFSEAASAHSNLVPEAAKTIIEETVRLKELLNTYLALLRSEPVIGKVDIRDLCRKVVQLLRYPALNSGVELHLEGDEDLPNIEGVPDRIQQAVLNLALNAVQATPRGGTVTLTTKAMNGYIRLDVADTGSGVPAELAPRLFEAKVSTKAGGAGLGLPLVRMIAEAHGGRVSFRPGVEGGSVFMLRLPVKRM